MLKALKKRSNDDKEQTWAHPDEVWPMIVQVLAGELAGQNKEQSWARSILISARILAKNPLKYPRQVEKCGLNSQQIKHQGMCALLVSCPGRFILMLLISEIASFFVHM